MAGKKPDGLPQYILQGKLFQILLGNTKKSLKN